VKKTVVWLIILLMALGLGAGAFQAFRQTSQPVSPTLSSSTDQTAKDTGKPAYSTREQVYANSHPDYSESEVRRDVRLGLDQTLYEEAQTVTDPAAVDVFVNKHWRLPEGYVPSDLVDVQGIQLRQPAADAWNRLQSDLKSKGIPVTIQTGWISGEDTDRLYQEAVAEYGQERTDLVFAKPGFFDANTGLSLDFGLEGSEDPASDPRYSQIIQEAVRHGFILRYTADNEQLSQTAAQPLHLRYVGDQLAASLSKDAVSFDEYFGSR